MSDGAHEFLPLSVPVVRGNEWAYTEDCLNTGWLSGAGAYVTRFEDAVRALTGARFAVATTTGTAALHVALSIAGVGAGDAVIVPTATFIASANAVHYTGAQPILVGCDEHLGLDADALEAYLDSIDTGGELVDDVTGLRVKAIMPVHIFGDPCDMVRVLEIAERFGLAVIEDATESLGSYYTQGPLAGRYTGTLGMAGAFSFNGNKLITTGGGGMIVTDDEEFAKRARYLVGQAKDDPVRYVHGTVGFNYALTNVSAAIGVAQMEQIESFIETKRRNRARYTEGLADVPGITVMQAPEGTFSNSWFFTLLVDADEFGMDREALMQALSEAKIQSRPLWLPVHMNAPYAGCRVVSPERAVWFWERILNVPCSSDLTEADVDRVVSTIRSLARG
ncbi:MAG TPA: LegC family aminotransferase [Coriobacteriia bacterium]|nr:LegC family aminotransferase [Coriobacteriia bacterium]